MPFRFHSIAAPIGLDLSGRSLCALQLARRRSDAPVASAVRLPRTDPLSEIGVDEIRHAADVLQRKGFRGRSVVLAMPHEHLMTEIVDGMGGDAAPGNRIRDEIARSHRVEPDSFELAYWALPDPRPGRTSSTVMAVACRHESSESYIELFEEAGFDVCGLDVQPWALARACRNILTEAGGAFVVDAGWDGAHLAVLDESTVLYTRTMSDAALSHVHREVAESLALDHQMTSYLIDEVGLDGGAGAADADPALRSAVQGHLAGYVEKLETELRRSIDYVRHEYPSHALERLIVVGEGSVIPGLHVRLTETIDVPAPPIALQDLAGFHGSPGGIAQSSVLTTALGLARYPRR